MMPSESEAIAIVSRKIKEHERLFSKLGLAFNESYTENLVSSGRSDWFIFYNSSNSYRVSITFSVLVAKNQQSSGKIYKGAMFGAYITRPDKKNLSVEDYLRAHNLVSKEILFACTQEVSDFDKHVETFLNSLESIFANELKPILDGKEWENVPIDWSGYK